jgi:hypothetical protein
MTLITLSSGTVLANDYTLPIIVISKVLMANDNNPRAKNLSVLFYNHVC